MSLLVILFRLVLLYGVFFIPGALLGAALFGRWGSFIYGLSVLFWILGCAMSSEWNVRRLSRAQRFPLINRKQKARSQRNSGLQLYVFPEVLPSVLVVKSLGSQGSLFVSQGLISTLTEFELDHLLQFVDEKMRREPVVFQSLCSTLISHFLFFVPQNRPTFSINPTQGFLFLLFYPWVNFLNRMRNKPKVGGLVTECSVFERVPRCKQLWGIPETRGLLKFYSLART